MRGGFWRSFQVKYREINDLHKQMLRASAKVDAMAPGAARDAARDHLHQGQSNDCYWHGLFGGIYIAHMRLATAEHLIAAEDAADRAARAAGAAVDGIAELDLDLDGSPELLATAPGQSLAIEPAEGGGIGTWDVRAMRHALCAVLRRRPEAYHARLVAFEAVGQGEPAVRRAAEVLERLEADMMQAAAELDFERAARIRDQIAALRSGKGPGRKGAGPRGGGRGGRIPRPRSI